MVCLSIHGSNPASSECQESVTLMSRFCRRRIGDVPGAHVRNRQKKRTRPRLLLPGRFVLHSDLRRRLPDVNLGTQKARKPTLLAGRKAKRRANQKRRLEASATRSRSKVKSYSNCHYLVTNSGAGLFTATVKFPLASNRPVLQKSTDAGGYSIKSGLGSFTLGPPSLHQLDPGVGDKNP
jgi:hypothetical protein